VAARSKAARLLRSWVQIPPRAWMFVCCECCLLSGRGLCDELITRPEESYRLWCVVMCDLETSGMRRPWPALGRSATGNIYIYIYIYIHKGKIYFILQTAVEGSYLWLIVRKRKSLQDFLLKVTGSIQIPKLNEAHPSYHITSHFTPVTALVIGVWLRLRLKRDGTRADTRFRLSTKRKSPFKSAWSSSSVDYWQPKCAHER